MTARTLRLADLLAAAIFDLVPFFGCFVAPNAFALAISNLDEEHRACK